jgi:hypothetical protein
LIPPSVPIMTQIKIARPKWTEEERFQAMVEEAKTGLRLQQYGEKAREEFAAAEARQYRGKQQRNAVTRNMRHVAEIPATEFFNLTKKYGHDEVHSKGFIKHLQKHYPHLATSRV